jgi:hypothetical protein
MKKYFFGLTAVVCALAFSAFTKPFTMMTFKLKTNPVAADIVNNPAQWTNSILGQYYGACSGPTEDLACTIQLDNLRTSYFHTEFGEVILNTLAYANANQQDYLLIAEDEGLVSCGVTNYIISSIQPKHYLTTNTFENVSLWTDLFFVNGQKVDE